MYLFFLLAGLLLILVGADWLTDGAAEVAKRFHMSEFVVGLTVIAIGTSTPELAVSFLSAMKGQTEMAVGNVVGSNIFNVFVTVGVCALITPIALTRNNIRRDIPIGVAISLLLLACGYRGVITRGTGIAMMVLYAAYLWYTVCSSEPEPAAPSTSPSPAPSPAAKPVKERRRHSGWIVAAMIVTGLCALVGGGEMFVRGATEVARRLGVSESVIAITLVAGGTSLPELASSAVSLMKGHGGMALGNALGSNTANILLVLGASATVRPLTFGTITTTDLYVVLASAVALFLSAFTFRRREIDRWEGTLFIIFYTAYIAWLIKTGA